MKRLRNGAALVLLGLILLRVVAWLVTPQLIVLVCIIVALVAMIIGMLGGPRHLS